MADNIWDLLSDPDELRAGAQEESRLRVKAEADNEELRTSNDLLRAEVLGLKEEWRKMRKRWLRATDDVTRLEAALAEVKEMLGTEILAVKVCFTSAHEWMRRAKLAEGELQWRRDQMQNGAAKVNGLIASISTTGRDIPLNLLALGNMLKAEYGGDASHPTSTKAPALSDTTSGEGEGA